MQIKIATNTTTITETTKYIAHIKTNIDELQNKKIVSDVEEVKLKELKDDIE